MTTRFSTMTSPPRHSSALSTTLSEALNNASPALVSVFWTAHQMDCPRLFAARATAGSIYEGATLLPL